MRSLAKQIFEELAAAINDLMDEVDEDRIVVVEIGGYQIEVPVDEAENTTVADLLDAIGMSKIVSKGEDKHESK